MTLATVVRTGALLPGLWLVSLACAGPPSSGPAPGPSGTADAGSGSPPTSSPSTRTPQDVPHVESCAGTARDHDGDGFAAGQDCNDCTAQINPGAFDVPSNGVDEDCDGVDAAREACDDALTMGSTSPEDAARAIGLCRFVREDDAGWGVLSARFTTADGAAYPASMTQVGLLPRFGSVEPPAGASMLALSSGVARAPDQPSYTDDCDLFDHGGDPWSLPASDHRYPQGFAETASSCRGAFSGGIFDPVALEVRLRVPTNARGLRFASNFFTHEYPIFICTEFNDFFAVMKGDEAGSWENIVFDGEGNPVSVNNGLLQACDPGTHNGKTFRCPLGRDMLAGTGFDGSSLCAEGGGFDDGYGGWPSDFDSDTLGGAATGWLQTTAPVRPGSVITLRFAIWDSSDPDLDSLALIDGFGWEVVEGYETPPEDVEPPTTETTPLI